MKKLALKRTSYVVVDSVTLKLSSAQTTIVFNICKENAWLQTGDAQVFSIINSFVYFNTQNTSSSYVWVVETLQRPPIFSHHCCNTQSACDAVTLADPTKLRIALI